MEIIAWWRLDSNWLQLAERMGQDLGTASRPLPAVSGYRLAPSLTRSHLILEELPLGSGHVRLPQCIDLLVGSQRAPIRDRRLGPYRS